MSASSARRIKERGGGGGRVAASMAAKPSKTLTPVSAKLAAQKSAGKENHNSRAISTGRAAVAAQKPAIRPIPRTDRLSVCSGDVGESRVRQSTSSVTKGRSSSPFEFNRILSDMRKGTGGAVERSLSRGRKSTSGVRVLERSQQNKDAESSENNTRFLKDTKVSVYAKVSLEKSSQISKICKLTEESKKSRPNLCPVVTNSCLDGRTLEPDSDFKVKVSDNFKVHEESKGISSTDLRSVRDEKRVNCIDTGVKELGQQTQNGSRGLESLKQNDLEEGMGDRSINKYPSKLHEKLAFLEGRVKRIASDIKRTKEMLDMNNPDTSKAILSDIQEKISGIEKAIGNVVNGPSEKIDAPCSAEKGDIQHKTLENSQIKAVGCLKSSYKGLNAEELEARHFPHHKLLRSRTSLKASSESSQNHQSNIESCTELKPQEKLLSPIHENLIALEFLASLNKDQSKVTRRGENVGLDVSEVQETDGYVTSTAQGSVSMANRICDLELMLRTNETLDEFDDQENRPGIIIEEEAEDSGIYQLNEIGRKSSTGGWFVLEGEAVLLAHDDGSCSFYDIANCEEKAEYRPPVGTSPNVWRDCWIIRAPGVDGWSGRYVVAASAGNTLDSGFCSWDFYTKDVRAFHMEDETTSSRTALAPISNTTLYRRNTLSACMAPQNQQWWYKPCGPLIVSTASSQKAVRIYDIRDGEQVMKWEVQKPVLEMDYSSPLQWRNRGKVVVAETESISLWDVSSLNSQALLSVSSFGRKVSALHVNNTDAELGGGVRQRVSSVEVEGNDGVFCTADSINVLDFRQPSGVGLKIPILGVNVQSVFSHGDSIFIGCTNARLAGIKQPCSQVQQFSLRKQRLFSTYSFPEANAHAHCMDITQVWGNSDFVMGACGLGLFVFDALKDDGLQSSTIEFDNLQKVRETIGPDDLYSPSFDYLSSRVLLISRDRPALWRYLT
ncbi:KIN14B-interacting protein At4g14310-like [Diospyros lotus]|uniref:KIN14B-interacting protein At4g14310-like n=1 Tax=Diospyros lotus TaxID=55363 RepID=UPI00225880BA|nr:KIN14B-interacting protein At4g14310-like [Diospyros lotus]